MNYIFGTPLAISVAKSSEKNPTPRKPVRELNRYSKKTADPVPRKPNPKDFRNPKTI